MSGFVVMQREALDHPLLRDGDRFRAWFWLIAHACWKPTRVIIKGEIIELGRGDMTFSQRFLAEKWGWSKSRVDRFMSDLRDHNMIETRSKNGATKNHAAGQGQAVITICNYDKYQNLTEQERGSNLEEVRGNVGATAGQQRGKEEPYNHLTIEEGSLLPPSPPSKSKPAVKAKARPATPVDHPLPEDWEPSFGPKTAAMVAAWPEKMLEREEFRFRNHAAAHDRKAKNWNAAFAMWLSIADERLTANGASNGQRANYPSRDQRDGVASAIDDRLEELAERAPPTAGRFEFGDDGSDRVVPIASARAL